MKSPIDITDAVKKIASNGGSIGFRIDPFVIPLKPADKKAIEIIEMLLNDDELEDVTFREIYEMLDFAKFWLEFIQLMNYNDAPHRTADMIFGTDDNIKME